MRVWVSAPAYGYGLMEQLTSLADDLPVYQYHHVAVSWIILFYTTWSMDWNISQKSVSFHENGKNRWNRFTKNWSVKFEFFKKLENFEIKI
jgi:hypothetical protein